jgi:enoyl-[acyl-carrier-protein] reductase (NADH)
MPLSSSPTDVERNLTQRSNAVVFLASDESSYITGIELFVDDGVAQVGPTLLAQSGRL